MALTADIGANTREAQRNIKDLSKALDDNSDALDDLAREGTQAGDKIERTFRDMVRDAGKAETAVKDVGEKGFKRASDGAKDFKQEANQSAKETAASFDGSAESIGGMFQEVAANAFGGFGPAGAAAGLAAAAGIGLAAAGFEQMEEARQASIERINEWADQFIEAGGRALSGEQLQANIKEILNDEERMGQAMKIVTATGMDQAVVIAALAGDLEAATAVSNGFKRRQDEVAEATKNGAIQVASQRQEMLNGIVAWEKFNGEVDKGGNKYRTFNDALKATTAPVSELDKTRAAIDNLPTNKTIKLTLDDSEVRSYRPPTVKIPATFETRGREWQ